MAVDLIVLNSSLSVNGWQASRMPNAKVTQRGNWSESRISKSPFPRRKYKVPMHLLNATSRAYLRQFYDLRNGPVFGFLLWDRDENYLNNVALGTGNGSTTTFQITASITDAARTITRNIYHPVPTGTAVPAELQGLLSTPTTTVVTDNGVTKTEGVDYTVSASTGIVTFASAPANTHALTISVPYFVAVRFAEAYEFDLTLNSLYGDADVELLEVFE